MILKIDYILYIKYKQISRSRKNSNTFRIKHTLNGGNYQAAQRLLDYTSGFDVDSTELESLAVESTFSMTLWRGLRTDIFQTKDTIPIKNVTSTSLYANESVTFMWECPGCQENPTLLKIVLPQGFPQIPVDRTLEKFIGRPGFYPKQREVVLLSKYKGKQLYFTKKEELSGEDVSEYAVHVAIESYFQKYPEYYKFKDRYKNDFTLIVVEPSYR